MNKIFKVIWNDILCVFQVVNEITKSRTKSNRSAVVREGSRGEGAQSYNTKSSGFNLRLLSTALMAVFGFTFTSVATAKEIVIEGITLTAGSGVTESVTLAEKPNKGDVFVFDFSANSGNSFGVHASNLWSQDETSAYYPTVLWSGGYVDGLTIKVLGGNDDGSITSDLGSAKLTYILSTSTSDKGLSLTTLLQTIDLQAGDTNNFLVQVAESTGDLQDLKAYITGDGHITFGFNGENPGRLILGDQSKAGEKSQNDYTGYTYVGLSPQNTGGQPVSLIFAQSESFGETAQLSVSSGSDVRFGGVNDDLALTQTVGGLLGGGYS